MAPMRILPALLITLAAATASAQTHDSGTARCRGAAGRRGEDRLGARHEGHQAGHRQGPSGQGRPGRPCDYTGWTTDGKMFDSSHRRKASRRPFRVNRVIAGFSEGLQLMVPGETRRLWIPEALAYKGQESRPKGMLVFDVDAHRHAESRAERRQGAAGRREENRERTRVQSAVEGHRRAPSHGVSQVTVHYTGWTTDGKMFDSSVVRGEPIDLPAERRDRRVDRRRAADGRRREDAVLDSGEPRLQRREPAVRHARVRRRADQDPVGREGQDRAGWAGRRGYAVPGILPIPAFRPAPGAVRACPALSSPCPLVLPVLTTARIARAEAIGERAPRLVRHESDPRPVRLRLTHILQRGAQPARRRPPCRRSCWRPAPPSASPPAASVGDSAASALRGGRPAQPSDFARSSIRCTSDSMRLRFASGSRSVPANACGQRVEHRLERRARNASSSAARVRGRRRARRFPAAIVARSARTLASEIAPAPVFGSTARPSSSATMRFARGDALVAGDVVALGVAREEAIAGAAEALPDRIGPRLLHRSDRLPLGLQPSQLRRRPAPSRSTRRALPPCTHSASFFARFSAHAALRSARSAWRRVKKRSQAARNRSQTAFSCPRVTGPIVFHSACSFLISSAV